MGFSSFSYIYVNYKHMAVKTLANQIFMIVQVAFLIPMSNNYKVFLVLVIFVWITWL